MSELEQDFDSVLKELNVKLKEAADKMREVNELRVKAGFESLIFSQWEREEAYSRIRREVNESEAAEDPDFDEDYVVDEKMEELRARYDLIEKSPLEREINRAGWSTSSSYC